MLDTFLICSDIIPAINNTNIIKFSKNLFTARVTGDPVVKGLKRISRYWSSPVKLYPACSSS